MLFYEKLAILSVVMDFNGDRSSILLRLKFTTIKLMHSDRHYNEPMAWLGRLIVKITYEANLLVMVLRMGMVNLPDKW